jgi:hypothetical protein
MYWPNRGVDSKSEELDGDTTSEERNKYHPLRERLKLYVALPNIALCLGRCGIAGNRNSSGGQLNPFDNARLQASFGLG